MTTTTPRRRSRTRALTLGLATVLALVLATAAPAGATVGVTAPSTGTSYVDTEQVTLTGTVPTGTTSIAVAQCKVTTVPGSRCHIGTAISPTSAYLTTTGYVVAGFELTQAWAPDWNLATGAPFPVTGTSTSCTSIGTDSCVILVSFYGTTGFLGADASAVLPFH